MFRSSWRAFSRLCKPDTRLCRHYSRSKKQAAENAEEQNGILAGLPAYFRSLQVAPEGDDAQNQNIDPRAVSFLPGSNGAEHAFFPLTGSHAQLECEACHAEGRFSGTPNQCESCHNNVKPARHFTGDCAACHSTNTWQEIHFDHAAAGTKDCLSCHTRNRPANHFPGQCSSCHTTRAWRPASFSHQGLTDCASCHTKNKPANHFPGQCSKLP